MSRVLPPTICALTCDERSYGIDPLPACDPADDRPIAPPRTFKDVRESEASTSPARELRVLGSRFRNSTRTEFERSEGQAGLRERRGSSLMRPGRGPHARPDGEALEAAEGVEEGRVRQHWRACGVVRRPSR
eukprot:scaffold98700_cov25-Tisochrysis_lutea.AAC.5